MYEKTFGKVLVGATKKCLCEGSSNTDDASAAIVRMSFGNSPANKQHKSAVASNAVHSPANSTTRHAT